VTRIEETDPAVSKTGPWITRGAELASFSGGTAVSSDVADASTSLTFTGTAVSWLGWRCELCGIARVVLDGAATTVDTFAPTRDPASSVVFSASGLASGSHTLVIEVTGTSNPSASGANIVVDAFDVTSEGSGPPPTTTRIEQTDPSVSYTGTWFPDKSEPPGTSGGTYAESVEAGARATITFTGTAVSWISARADQAGIANVYVDGTLVDTVDTYSPTLELQANLFTASGLSRGTHTLTIEVTGTKNPSSSDVGVVVDAFDVTS
jgi:hypothetical protein